MTPPRVLLIQLLDYIKEQAKEINPQGYRLASVRGFMRARNDIAGLPGAEFDLRIEGDHIWLRVPRLAAEPPPKPPQTQQEFLRISSDPDGPQPTLDEPALLNHLNRAIKEGGPDGRGPLEARIRSAAASALESYTVAWKSWAEGERPRRKTVALYGDLFALMHQMEAEETSKPLELVWGIGIASWLLTYDSEDVAFEYPLLTQTIEISLDETTMAIDLRPRATDTRVELDAFVACHVAGSTEVERASREHLVRHKERPVTPFDPSSYSDVLKLMAAKLDSEGTYCEVLTRDALVPPAGSHLIVTDAWVLISRPRAVNYLFDDLRRLQERLQDGCEIPDGPAALVTPPSNQPIEYEAVSFRGISSRGAPGGASIEELYFSLPYNDEQVTIVQRLRKAAGVTVQGPPGTGKTHTIANIICHYLASGLRVLVTSRGEAALSVLQAKIPEEVRPLTVALLTSDREGVRQFKASIEAIQHRVSQLNPELTRQEISRLQSAIDRAHADLAAIDRRVDEIAFAQLAEIEVDGTPMRAQKLAELVLSGHDQFGWFDDPINLSPRHAPPLTEDDAGHLREARRHLGRDIIYVEARVPSADDFPSDAVISELHKVLVKRDSIQAEVDRGDLLSLRANTSEVLAAAGDLLTFMEEPLSILADLEALGEGWPLDLRIRCRQPSFAAERSALESLFTDVDSLIAARAEFLKRPVTFLEAGLSSPKTLEALARAAETGKPFGFVAIGTSDAKEHIAAIRVTGRTPSGMDDWAHVQRFVKLHEQIQSFVIRWNELAEGLSVPRLNGGVSRLRNVELVATAAKKAHRLATEYDTTLVKKAQAVFEHTPTAELIGSRAKLESIRQQLIRYLTLAALSSAATRLSDFQNKLAGKSGPISEEIRAFLDVDLGNSSMPPERVAARYGEIRAELRRIAGLSTALSTVHDAALRIESAGAAKLASRIRGTKVASSGEDTTFPATWRQAWNWARMRSHLESIEGREELVSLASRRRELESGLARFYKEMVAKAAWLATKKNATPRILQALAGYATAIRRIGQGTGPNATRYRRDAREAMHDAAGAVPCWIMSHNRISEAMPADIGAFDLVIVDEASQSDLWALPAILRGKKILVVGDDKQVSPDAGFIDSNRIQELRDRFLVDQPFGAEMTPEKSLYDLAARVFAAEQVMLREHFRCVPPIIAYSNRTFYKNQILPLRIPRASERIEPPLVDLHVLGGSRDQHDRNDYEAEAIAEEIAAILRDEKFSKRSIGVVSLLGTEQAKHIASAVNRRCDAAELHRRRFLCGDARTFQGSERDIMFLSLVVDPADCRAISGNMFDQRFNVAASRARDRMYLVRSVTASELSDADLRKTLLSHFDKPLVVDREEAALLVDRCESGFERQVFSGLVSRGYRVIPQVKTGAYRIDMVVEGLGDVRLAIECDGDEFHGPDRWQHDMNRQRVLERAGWVFWRCFASTWMMRKDEVLSELLERLYAMGIEPVGAMATAPSLVEKRVWRCHEPENESKEPYQTQTV
jgi:very-short-patch-repair endonuclease